MDPPNNRHTGSRDLVRYVEVVPIRSLTRKPHPSIAIPRLKTNWGVWLVGGQISDFRINPKWCKSTKWIQLSRCHWLKLSTVSPLVLISHSLLLEAILYSLQLFGAPICRSLEVVHILDVKNVYGKVNREHVVYPEVGPYSEDPLLEVPLNFLAQFPIILCNI